MRMPAEWERHAATWLAWPSNPETWPGCLEHAEVEFRTLVTTLAEYEPVQILVQDAAHARHVHDALPAKTRHPVQLFEVPTDDAWLRDTGPTFVWADAGLLVAVAWRFNAWGGKYPPWDRDDAVARRVGELAKVDVREVDLVMEGGAIDVDGEGTILVTESTLLTPTRNPGVTRTMTNQRLGELLGVREVVWLKAGISGDDTDGHVDDIARFVAPARVVCCIEPDPHDPNHLPLADCRARLAEARDAQGRSIELIDLPMPPAIEADGERLPASYANFYIANGVVLVPSFGVPTDEEALRILGRALPRHRVVPLPSRSLVRGLGAVHCLTQQQPAVPRGGTR